MSPPFIPTYRYYAPIWETLKRDKQVSITANRLLHPRIIKAVTKEKWMDIGWKLMITPKIAILSHTRQNSVLTFYLEISENRFDFRTRNQITIKDI